MRQTLRQAAKSLTNHPLVESTIRRVLKGTRVLSYHRFPVELAGELERQCAYFRRNFTLVSLDTFALALRDNRPLPENSLVVTVDDGYEDSYSVAAPIFQKHGIPATVYLVSDFLDRKTWLWWDQLSYAFARSRNEQIMLHLPGRGPETIKLGSAAERQNHATQCALALLRINCMDAQQDLQQICEDLGVSIPSEPSADFLPLSWEKVKEMSAMGISFGSHTVSHRILGTIPSWEERRHEVTESKRRIEEMSGLEIRHFCFPNGGIGDFAHSDINLVRSAGYNSAATLMIGVATAASDPFLIPRITVNPELPFDFFRMKVAGLWHFRGANQPHRLPIRFE